MVWLQQTFLVIKYQKKTKTFYLHSLHNCWFCYENGKEKLSTGLFGRMQIQNKKDKNDQIEIKSEIKSESESESESEPELILILNEPFYSQ